MARQGKAGVHVAKKKDHTEVSFWGRVNGVPTRMHMLKLVDPQKGEIGDAAKKVIDELRAKAG